MYSVYLVYSGTYEDCDVEGVFSSLEPAIGFVGKNWKDWDNRCSIEERPLNVTESTRYIGTQVVSWKISIDQGGRKHLGKPIFEEGYEPTLSKELEEKIEELTKDTSKIIAQSLGTNDVKDFMEKMLKDYGKTLLELTKNDMN